MTEKHHMDQNPYIFSLCPKPTVVTDNMTRGDDVADKPGFGIFLKSVFNTCQLKSARRVSIVGKAVLPQSLVARPS
jgi:hypothetical protein